MWRYLLPLFLFSVLVVFLSIGLYLDPKKVPSPLIGKPAPSFQLSELQYPDQVVVPERYRQNVWLLNVWASWCVSCRQEHHVLNRLARDYKVNIIGLNYKDKRADGIRWLEQRGNPYIANAFDEKGRAGIDWGVYAVPETFIIDQKGVIRYKHTGPVNQMVVDDEILPLLRKLHSEVGL